MELKIQIVVKSETEKNITFYLYVSSKYHTLPGQTLMTLPHDEFHALCSLLTKGQIGMPLENVTFAKGCALRWADDEDS